MTTPLSSEQRNQQTTTKYIHHSITRRSYRSMLTSAPVLAMVCAYLILDAVLPLYGLWFHTASLGLWTILPSRLLFPGWQLTPTLLGSSNGTAPPFALSWETTGLLLLSFILVFLCYLIALRILFKRVGILFVALSTALLGLTLLVAPVVTSQDIYSYIIYARMQVIYHLNPLITSPMTIATDPTYAHLYWTDQPSAYGPTWIVLTGLLQWFTDIFGTTFLMPMILALRALNLLAHLGSTLLLWSLSGWLQQVYGYKNNNARMAAILAFAWNPLLLFEACVNAHNDTVMLFLVLLALWCLTHWSWRSGYLLAAFVFALATCLKVNVALLVPALLLFVWLQPHSIQARLYDVALTLAVYVITIVMLYAPFWSHGSILLILHVNPGTFRATNSLQEFFSHLYNSLVSHSTQESGFPAEVFLRIVSEVGFVIVYLGLCWYALRRRFVLGTGAINRRTTASMVRWMAVAWLLYCLLGSPWFWPWYLITFFGLFALLEALPDKTFVSKPSMVAVRVLAFCMLSLYCFYAWSPYGSFAPFLFHFRWAYLRGLWAWLPFLLLLMPFVWSRKRILDEKVPYPLS